MPARAVLPTFGIVPPECIPPGLTQRSFECDEEADLPTSGFGIGSRAVCIAEKSFWQCVEDELWVKSTLAAVAQVSLLDQAGPIGLTKIYFVPVYGVGMYRISYSAKVTTPDSVSSSLGGTNGLQIGYKSASDNVDVITGPNTVSSGNDTQTQISGVIIINAQVENWIMMEFGYDSTKGDMRFALHLKIEIL